MVGVFRADEARRTGDDVDRWVAFRVPRANDDKGQEFEELSMLVDEMVANEAPPHSFDEIANASALLDSSFSFVKGLHLFTPSVR